MGLKITARIEMEPVDDEGNPIKISRFKAQNES